MTVISKNIQVKRMKNGDAAISIRGGHIPLKNKRDGRALARWLIRWYEESPTHCAKCGGELLEGETAVCLVAKRP